MIKEERGEEDWRGGGRRRSRGGREARWMKGWLVGLMDGWMNRMDG